MTLKLLFFAAIRDLVGADEADFVVEKTTCTVHELSALLEVAYEPLRGRMASIRFARNEEFALGGEKLSDGDVIALIPPVAGG